MLTSNPFAQLSATISPGVMQTYVILMLLLVVGGTLYDVWHKGRKAGERRSLAVTWRPWRSRRPSPKC